MRRKHLGVILNKVSWVGIPQPTVGVDDPSGNVKYKKQNLMDPYCRCHAVISKQWLSM